MKIGIKEITIDGKTICSTLKMKEYEKPMYIITALLVDNAVRSSSNNGRNVLSKRNGRKNNR